MAALRAPRLAGLVLSPDDSAAAAARAVLRFYLRAFASAEPAARAGEVEPVHQLRVATRRLRTALRRFGPLLPARFAAAAHRDLAWLGGAIGAVRDLDVLSELLRGQAARLDPELRRAGGPLGVMLQEQRARALAALGTALDAKRCRRLLERLAAFADSRAPVGRGTRLGDVAPDLLRPHVRAVVRAGRRLGPDAAPPHLHRLRVRVKRLRYALETLRSLGDRATRELLARLERLQDTLGKGQDAATAIAWLGAYAESPGVPVTSLLPAGALIQALARRGGGHARPWSRLRCDLEQPARARGRDRGHRGGSLRRRAGAARAGRARAGRSAARDGARPARVRALRARGHRGSRAGAERRG